MSSPVTKEQIIEFIRGNVDRTNPRDDPPEFYDYADGHDTCYYFSSKGEPGCVMGNILASAGWTQDQVPEGTTVNGSIFINFFDSEETRAFAAEVQSHADEGATWGVALDAAIENLGE